MDNQADFEARMRSMILNNGVPRRESEQQDGSLPVVTSPTTGRRLTQAQRRQGMSNRVDLGEQANRRGHMGQSSAEYGPRPVQHQVATQNMGFGSHQHNQQYPTGAAGSSQSWRDFAARSQTSDATHRTIDQPSAQTAQHFGTIGAMTTRAHQSSHHSSTYPSPRNSAGAARPPSSHQSNDFYGRPSSSGRSLFEPSAGPQVDLRPPFRQADYVEALARQRIPEASMPDRVMAENDCVRRHLERLCREVFQALPETQDVAPHTVVLECFGSIASGFATADSDMDIMLLYDSCSDQSDQHKGVPRALERILLDSGFGARLLTRTRVPIIRFCERPPPELLHNLRKARAEWDEEMAKLIAEGKSADDTAAHGDDEHAANEDASEGDDQQVGSPDGSAPGSHAPGDKTSKKGQGKKKEKKEQERRPPPYNNDEERISLYRLAIKEDWFTPEERRIILNYADAYQQAAGDLENTTFQNARQALDSLPDVLSRFREPKQRKQELEYPKEGVGVLCDINFAIGEHSNPLAIHNTRLLRCYSMFDTRIRQMVIFVKAWAKIRKINKPYHGTLSSYGYVLMVLHFAVNIANPPLAPNLQQMHYQNVETNYPAPTTCNGYDISFWQDPQAIQTAAHREYGRNQQSLGSLLAQFFRYYAVGSYRGAQGFQWMKDVISLRTPGGLITKESKGWTGATEQAMDGEDGKEGAVKITHRYLLAIEDPFEHTHNVGRPVMHHGIIAIRDEFRRANQLIIGQGMWDHKAEDFFAEGVEKERAHRYFGPNPKHQKPRKTDPSKPNTQKPSGNTKTDGSTEKPAVHDSAAADKLSTPAARRGSGQKTHQRQASAQVEAVADAFPALSVSNPAKTQTSQQTIHKKPPKKAQQTTGAADQGTNAEQTKTQPRTGKNGRNARSNAKAGQAEVTAKPHDTNQNSKAATAQGQVKAAGNGSGTQEGEADASSGDQGKPRKKPFYRKKKPKPVGAGSNAAPN